jgi:hypothetical protein
MSWLAGRDENSVHAVVTDPPYGLHEYTTKEQSKLRAGKGGVWRIPPSFDGHQRSPLPRFTVLTDDDRATLQIFFKTWARLLYRVVVPGSEGLYCSAHYDDARRGQAKKRAQGIQRGECHAPFDVGAVGDREETVGRTGPGQFASVEDGWMAEDFKRPTIWGRDPIEPGDAKGT